MILVGSKTLIRCLFMEDTPQYLESLRRMTSMDYFTVFLSFKDPKN